MHAHTLVTTAVFVCMCLYVAGSTPVHAELEALVADFVGTEDAICFGMGFATNAAALPALAGPGTLVLSDALNHTSIIAGVKASGAAVRVFRHNDMAHLEKLLRFHIAEGQKRTRRPWKKARAAAMTCSDTHSPLPCLISSDPHSPLPCS